uniref:Uncharacterized protein n=1 Tax=Mycena chlorophos TaxID=658473 RepID=A0ABQ0LYQ4_MYCCL|nr:predicted protein [Mycena chlorophos]
MKSSSSQRRFRAGAESPSTKRTQTPAGKELEKQSPRFPHSAFNKRDGSMLDGLSPEQERVEPRRSFPSRHAGLPPTTNVSLRTIRIALCGSPSASSFSAASTKAEPQLVVGRVHRKHIVVVV